MPWNPQRIEQRIGRCHRYGQKYDVVVVNFLNKANAADQRVYELLAEKFQLFSGVFGASNEVLGSIESGVDFEKRNIAMIEPLRGRSGWLTAALLTVNAFETEDHVLLTGMTDDGHALEAEQCQRLFMLNAVAQVNPPQRIAPISLRGALDAQKQHILSDLSEKKAYYFEQEVGKLDHWGEDQRAALKELEDQIRDTKKAARLAPNLPEKLKLEREKRQLDTKRDEAWKHYEQAAKEIEARNDALIDVVEKAMQQAVSEAQLFTVCWKIA